MNKNRKQQLWRADFYKMQSDIAKWCLKRNCPKWGVSGVKNVEYSALVADSHNASK